MQKKYYVTMACTVAGYRQSDYLLLLKRHDGTIVGYSSEFEALTSDIRVACAFDKTDMDGSIDRSLSAKWFGLLQEEWSSLVPAALDEIKALGLEDCVIGSKVVMEPKMPIDLDNPQSIPSH